MSSLPAAPSPARVIALLVPDWSLLACRRVRGIAPGTRLAIIDKGRVVASSRTAQHDGVTPGLKVREAQVRCPEIILEPYDPGLEARAFDPLLRAIEEFVPHLHVVRPGLIGVRALGVTRFYGSEHAAASLLRNAIHDQGIDDVRAAVADGLFAAGQAAATTSVDHPWRVIAAGATPDFLAPLPIDVLQPFFADSKTPMLLRRMGIRTIGAYASLPSADVHARFGTAGLHAHRIAHGQDTPALRPHEVTPDLTARATLEPPTRHTASVVHACEPAIGGFVRRLTDASLTCQEARIVVDFESGAVDERVWRHPWPFTTSDLTERVRWQLQDLVDATGLDSGVDDSFGDAVISVTVTPASTEPAAHHEQGLWGGRPDVHVIDTVTNLQQRLGYSRVLTSTVVGGRLLHQRVELRPWGEASTPNSQRRTEQPWQGSLPGIPPTVVHSPAQPAAVTTGTDEPVIVDERGELNAAPRWLTPHDGRRAKVTAWAGPWPVHQHWWRQKPLRINRFQVITGDRAWLLVCDGQRWWSEARYE